MKKKIEPLSLEGIRTYSLESRKSLVRAEDFARPVPARGSFRKFVSTLPNFLAAKDFREIVARIAVARRRGKTILLGMGAHPIKVGLSPLIIRLMERGVLQGVALNGAGIIHDFEIAHSGRTSEDVAAEIGSGSFGMAEETGRELNLAIRRGWEQGRGIGCAVGAAIREKRLPFRRLSITAAGVRLGIPVTVHVAVGTDIIHLHPQACGEAIGEASHRDFRLFAALVSRLRGGVYLNLGSAVILPEVFLKALTLARNLGFPVRDFTTVNMDFFAHYRPLTNVVRRPTLEGGRGFHLTGHHEIMFPLLATAILEEIKRGETKRKKG
jgi:hypothetical protein